MRIISQGGNADLPYEEIALCMDCEDIIATHNNKEHLMARYSTMDKAKKAMEMLREQYKDYARVTNKSNFFTMFDYPKVFQFPQDEDVEV